MRPPTSRLLAATFLWSFGGMFVFFILNFHLEALGYTRGAIGLAQAVLSSVGVVFAPPAAFLIPRIGYGRILLLAGGMASIGVFAVGLDRWTYAALALYGIAGLLFQGALIPLFARNVTRHRTVSIYSLQAALTTAGGFAANLAAGYLTRVVAVDRVIFFALPAFLLATLLVSPGETRAASPTFRLRAPRLWLALSLPQILVGLGAGLVIPFLNLFLREKFHLDYAGVSWMFAVSSLATALSMLLQPPLARRLGTVRTIALMQGLSLPFLALLAWSTWIPLVTASLLIRGALMNSAWPVFNALAMRCLAEEERPGFVVAQNALWSLTWTIASGFSGTLQDALGLRAFDFLFGGTLILYGVATAYWLFVFPGIGQGCGRSTEGSV